MKFDIEIESPADRELRRRRQKWAWMANSSPAVLIGTITLGLIFFVGVLVYVVADSDLSVHSESHSTDFEHRQAVKREADRQQAEEREQVKKILFQLEVEEEKKRRRGF